MKRAIRLFVLLLIAAVSGCAANTPPHTPVQLSIWPPIQLAPKDWEVYGFMLTLPYGENRSVAGLDLGLLNFVDEEAYGAQVGLLANAGKILNGVQIASLLNNNIEVRGVQIAGLVNETDEKLRGVQIAGLFNMAPFSEEVDGVQLAPFLNLALNISLMGPSGEPAKLNGLQFALLNAVDELSGAQIGAACFSEKFRGAQIGVIYNSASRLHGVQVGLINYAEYKTTGVQIGLLNFMKDGFLPFFPLINFNFSRPSAQ